LGIKQDNATEHDETLFVFDGEDEDDAEHEIEIEDDLLDEDPKYSEKGYQDIFTDLQVVTPQEQPIIKFL